MNKQAGFLVAMPVITSPPPAPACPRIVGRLPRLRRCSGGLPRPAVHGAAWPLARSVRVSARSTKVGSSSMAYLREHHLFLRLFADYDAVVDACCRAWDALVAEPGCLCTLTSNRYHDQIEDEVWRFHRLDDSRRMGAYEITRWNKARSKVST